MIYIYGNGGFGREVAAAMMFYIAKIVNYIVDDRYFEGQPDTVRLSDFYPEMGKVLIAIGDPYPRQMTFLNLPIGTLLAHSYQGTVLDQNYEGIQPGCIIQPGAILTVNIRLGLCVHVNLNATIGHDCKIGDFVTIAPGANISGNVMIGNLCYIGSNAVIREKITICDNVTIGAGSVVVKDIKEPGTYVGNPVKKIK